jgi:outer membrane protein assembly factor BamE (lipoprotein component of BamABCDE complex)
MFQDTNPRFSLSSFCLSLLLAAFALCLAAPVAQAQTSNTNAAHAPAAAKNEAAADAPAFQEYKGVRIGMTADEARKKLGSPTDKGDAQDFYLVSPKESVQVMYDSAKKVSAIALIYMNAGANAPTAKAVMGSDIEAKPDGSLYKLVRYPKAGYWVSYSRTAGNSPIVSVTMQKIN